MSSVGVTSTGRPTKLRSSWWRRGWAWILGRGWETSVLLVLIVQTGFLASSAARHSPTVDEPVHLTAGLRYWETRRFDLNRGNPPLIDWWAAMPAAMAGAKTDWSSFPSSFLCGQDFMTLNGPRAFDYIIWGRWMLLPVGAIGGWICALWARQLYGRPAGLLAVVMWCCCPLLLANTETITGDMPSAVAAMATMYAGWLWMGRPSWRQTTILGLVLGLAQLSKLVCVALYPILFLTWLTWRLCRGQWRPGTGWGVEFLQGVVAVAISIAVINCGYLFDQTLQPLAKHGISRHLLKPETVETGTTPTDTTPTGSQPRIPWWANVPVPLPVNYLGGANEISQLFEHQHRTYFNGEWLPGGVWYYYLAGLCLKLPLGMLALFAVSFATYWLSPHLRQRWPQEIALIISATVFLVFVSSVTTVKYLRYALPAVPFIIILLSKSAEWIVKGPRIAAVGIVGLVTWTVVATVSVYPHQGSYFNELAGGPEHGAEYLIESSIDWGQDLFFLRDWLRDHADARPFYLAYFGNSDPQNAGIEFQLPTLEGGLEFADAQTPNFTPGYYAISKTLLQGFEWDAAPNGNGDFVYVRGRHFAYLKSCPIVGRAGHSILIFQITPEKVQELKTQMQSRVTHKANHKDK